MLTDDERKARQREACRKWRQSEKGKAYWAARRADPVKSAQDRAAIDDWQHKNKKRVRENGRRWYIENAKRVKDCERKRLATPEGKAQKKAAYQRRQARLRKAAGTFTGEDVLRLMSQQKNKCANPKCACDIADSYSIDHKMPLTRGGSNWPSNLQLLCRSCNSRKHTKTMDEFLELA